MNNRETRLLFIYTQDEYLFANTPSVGRLIGIFSAILNLTLYT